MYGDEFGKIPDSIWNLAVQNFRYEFNELRTAIRSDAFRGISEKNPATSIPGKAWYWIGSKIVESLSKLDQTLEEKEILSKINVPEIPPLDISESIDGTEMTSVVVLPEDECMEIRSKLQALTLSNEAVWDRERKRVAQGAGVPAPWYINLAYYALCYLLDALFNNRPLQRFWFLETVARMPYFSYISMLHLYESLGWWRQGSILRKVHFAEEWNELHHLQIMESLGGDQYWSDRFLGQHAAIFYYWILLLFYVLSPRLAYNFSELIEAHAVDTYGEFVDANEELLKSLPPPFVAVQYYRGDDLYLFDEFQTSNTNVQTRRPECSNLYDVFVNIRDDEGEHVKTMKGCQDETIVQDLEVMAKTKNAIE
eukprot:g756.t1